MAWVSFIRPDLNLNHFGTVKKKKKLLLEFNSLIAVAKPYIILIAISLDPVRKVEGTTWIYFKVLQENICRSPRGR